MAQKKAAPHAYSGLDRVMHEKTRLSILTALLSRPEGTLFPELKQLCDLTDGNLARHLQTLQEAGLVEVWKNQDGPRPRTLVLLSLPGRAAFLEYLAELERVVREARSAGSKPAARSTVRETPPGWVPA